MPQFDVNDGNAPYLWYMVFPDGEPVEYADLRIVEDRKYLLNIDPLHEVVSKTTADDVCSYIDTYIASARKEAYRILKKYGVKSVEFYDPVYLKADKDGKIPSGVYAAARIWEICESMDDHPPDINNLNVWDVHTFGLIVQYVNSDKKLLIKDYRTRKQNSSKGGKNKKGYEGDIKNAIKTICRSINSTSFPSFKNAILDFDRIEHLFESTKNPINIHEFTVNTSRGIIKFTHRDNQPGEKKINYMRKLLTSVKKELEEEKK